jgi:hypothetical protein
MREDFPDIDYLPTIFDHGNQPVFVACNVEHRQDSDRVCVREVEFDFGDIFPGRTLGDPIPVHQGLDGFRPLRHELRNRGLADDPHIMKLPFR